MQRIFWTSLVLAAAFLAQTVQAETYDFVLRNGRVVDGTGNPAFFADLAVKNGRVAAIGKITSKTRKEYDATGMIIAPGFIDVHTHAEEIEELPEGENFVRMGVTTLVLGNCGGSRLEVGKYFSKMEKINFTPNICTLIGHNTVRGKAMGGSFMRPPTDAELNQMKNYVEQAMKEGAVGLSTGLMYLPGSFAKTEELIELARVAGKYNGIYATHQRHEGDGIFDSLEEIFQIAREANVRAEISHIKLAGQANWGQTEKVIAAIEKARAEGLDITQDQYAYTASSTGMSQTIPDTAREGGREKFIERISDPKQKAAIIEEMKAMLRKRGPMDYSYAVIASCRSDKSLNGLNIVEAAKKVRGSDSLDDQIELLLDLEKKGGASGVFHGMSEEDIAGFMRHPNTMMASDSGVRTFGKDVPHPRGYGNNARVLGLYVREKKVISLEAAIRKMSSLPANTFRLKQRGTLREGNWADIVVFDPQTVKDNATYNDPHHYSTGFKYVFVNGALVVKDDAHTKARPGKTLRHVANN